MYLIDQRPCPPENRIVRPPFSKKVIFSRIVIATFADCTPISIIFRDHSTDDPNMYSFTSLIGDLTEEIIKDTLPLTPLMVLPPTYNATSEFLYRQTFLWLSPTNSSTPGSFESFSLISERSPRVR